MVNPAKRFQQNPLIPPQDAPPNIGDCKVECLLNPGAFRYQERIGLRLPSRCC